MTRKRATMTANGTHSHTNIFGEYTCQIDIFILNYCFYYFVVLHVRGLSFLCVCIFFLFGKVAVKFEHWLCFSVFRFLFALLVLFFYDPFYACIICILHYYRSCSSKNGCNCCCWCRRCCSTLVVANNFVSICIFFFLLLIFVVVSLLVLFVLSLHLSFVRCQLFFSVIHMLHRAFLKEMIRPLFFVQSYNFYVCWSHMVCFYSFLLCNTPARKKNHLHTHTFAS